MELVRLIIVSFGVVYSALALIAGGGLLMMAWVLRGDGGEPMGLLGVVLCYLGLLGLNRLPALMPAF